MGSSVFHGGFSTFIAICTLGMAKSFIFIVFFRLWFGIIVFGIANGFLFLPILLSIIGPINETISPEEMRRRDIEMEKSIKKYAKSSEPNINFDDE